MRFLLSVYFIIMLRCVLAPNGQFWRNLSEKQNKHWATQINRALKIHVNFTSIMWLLRRSRDSEVTFKKKSLRMLNASTQRSELISGSKVTMAHPLRSIGYLSLSGVTCTNAMPNLLQLYIITAAQYASANTDWHVTILNEFAIENSHVSAVALLTMQVHISCRMN